jgi:HK97 gp10 family phage protein
MHAASLELTKLARDLETAGRNAPKAVDLVLSNAAQFILVQMKQMVPVDTGRLRSSIVVQGSPGRYVVGPVGVAYAAYVEFGTSRMHAQPYVRPAVQKYLDELGEQAAKVGVAMIMGRGYAEHT